ncbi:hemolysin III, partial [Pseudomonas amygdali pv. aesculi str. 0893_23]
MYYGEKFNAWSHLVGAVLAGVGAIWLLVMASLHGDVWKVVSIAIYGACLVTLYSVSTIYHSVKGRSKSI